MKSSKAILGITLMSAMLFTSCGGDDAKPKTEDKTVKTADTTKKVEAPKVEVIAPADISVKLYFKAWVFDEEGNEVITTVTKTTISSTRESKMCCTVS